MNVKIEDFNHDAPGRSTDHDNATKMRRQPWHASAGEYLASQKGTRRGKRGGVKRRKGAKQAETADGEESEETIVKQESHTGSEEIDIEVNKEEGKMQLDEDLNQDQGPDQGQDSTKHSTDGAVTTLLDTRETEESAEKKIHRKRRRDAKEAKYPKPEEFELKEPRESLLLFGGHYIIMKN